MIKLFKKHLIVAGSFGSYKLRRRQFYETQIFCYAVGIVSWHYGIRICVDAL